MSREFDLKLLTGPNEVRLFLFFFEKTEVRESLTLTVESARTLRDALTRAIILAELSKQAF